MRKILSGIALVAAFAGTVNAQNNKDVLEGNGKSVTRDVAVQSFSRLKASGVYELKLSQGDKESVKIEADENLQHLFEVKNEGSQLVIDMKKLKNTNLKSKNKMRVHITFRKLSDVELSTVGNVQSENRLSFDDLKLENSSVGNVDLDMTANSLNVKNTSVGNVHLKGKAERAVFVNNGVGNLEAGDFMVQTLNIDNSGVGHAEVNAEKECKVKDSFLGKVKNRGSAPVRKTGKVVI
jgi:hypothetical protein